MKLFLKRFWKNSLLYFTIVALIYLFHSTTYNWTEYLTKPLALILLLKSFVSFGKNLHPGVKKGIILGLFFSFLSDISFLLRVDVSSWFLGGTFIFSLFAIYSYAYAFQFTEFKILRSTDFKSITPINLFLSLLIIIFPISIFIIEDLEIWQYPAILFQLLLWVLISQGLKRQDHVNEQSYYIVLSGIVLYSITTMLITLQNFTQNVFDFRDIPVLTYFTSQFLIIVGAIFQDPSIEHE